MTSPSAGAPTVIVLAAGTGSRLGKDKLALDLGGMPMLARTVACYAKATRVGDIVVIVGPGQKATWKALSSLTVHVAENPDPAKGMISSIRVGLQSAWTEGKDFLLAPADVPFVKSEIVDKIVVDFRARSCEILVPTYRGLGGHPGMYSAALQREFFLHGDTQGTREILFRHKTNTARVAVHDPDVCFDVDTEADAKIAMDASARWAHVDAEAEARAIQKKG